MKISSSHRRRSLIAFGFCVALICRANGAGNTHQQAPGSDNGIPRPAHCSNAVFSLCEAARDGKDKLVSKRLKEGYPVNMRNESGMTPLHLAVQNGHTKAVRVLLKEGADVLAKDKQGRTPAQLTKDAVLGKALKAARAKRERELDLFKSVSQGDATKLRAALADGIGPDIYAEDGLDTLVITATETRNNDALQILLNAGAQTGIRRQDGKTALHLAAGIGNVQAVRLLLKAGADPLIKANNGAAALHEAVWYGRLDAFCALLPVYKSVNFNPQGLGVLPEMVITRGNEQMLKALIDAGMRVNDPSFSKCPLLIAAAKAAQINMVRMLLAAGADKNAKDDQGRSAKDYASGEILKLLQ